MLVLDLFVFNPRWPYKSNKRNKAIVLCGGSNELINIKNKYEYGNKKTKSNQIKPFDKKKGVFSAEYLVVCYWQLIVREIQNINQN